MSPLSPAGSLKGIGGRFNIGNDLDRARNQAFGSLYLAENVETAFSEYFGGSHSEMRNGLTTVAVLNILESTSPVLFYDLPGLRPRPRSCGNVSRQRCERIPFRNGSILGLAIRRTPAATGKPCDQRCIQRAAIDPRLTSGHDLDECHLSLPEVPPSANVTTIRAA